MDSDLPINGALQTLNGKQCIYYDGYWIRYYAPPPESPAARKRLIDHLSRRLFHHTEPGINVPGGRLDEARAAYDAQSDPARKRVNAAMLAGALFNRASDIFRGILDLQAQGVAIDPENELMVRCAEYFQEALDLGTQVKHYSGHEGIDELWGEPFKVFTTPIEHFYESRYIKIAQAMADIDRVANALNEALACEPGFEAVVVLVRDFAQAAKDVSETIRRDPVLFELWPKFVATGEALATSSAALKSGTSTQQRQRAAEGERLAGDGKALLTYLCGARTSMPKSTREFVSACEAYAAKAGQ